MNRRVDADSVAAVRGAPVTAAGDAGPGDRAGEADRLRPRRVVPVPLAELARVSGAVLAADAGATPISGVTLRAQTAEAGFLFAALPGSRAHGARFAADAVAHGAVAILTDPAGAELVASVEELAGTPVLVHPAPRSVLGRVSHTVYGDPSAKLRLVGITGTSGKTTTAYLTEAALMAAGRTVGLLGTVETRIGGQAVPSSLTTPEAPDLAAMLARMVEDGVDAVVMEVSSHALSLGRVDGCRFAVGAFTNLSQDHLDFHPTMDDYFAAKARLFEEGSPVRAAVAVVCVDGPWGEKTAAVAGGPITVATGGRPDADWRAGESTPAADGTQHVTLTGPAGEVELTLGLPGRYNVANAALAVAIAERLGVEPVVAARGVAGVAVPGRVERVDRGQPFLAVVDYAHKPGAIEAVLGTLRAASSGRIAIVIGAGGDRDAGKREVMGAVSARGAELVVVTDDNPRSEDPEAIRAAVAGGARSVADAERPAGAEPTRVIGDRAAAVAAAVAWARPGDTVLVAGKGHERGQEIAGVKHPFDDRIVLAAAIDAAHVPASLVIEPTEPGLPGVRRAVRDLVEAARTRGGRSVAVIGEYPRESPAPPAGSVDGWVVEHDAVGRLAVRLDVTWTLCLGESRAVRGLWQGAVNEGSWANEAEMVPDSATAIALLVAALGPDDVVLVAVPDAPGLAEALRAGLRGGDASPAEQASAVGQIPAEQTQEPTMPTHERGAR